MQPFSTVLFTSINGKTQTRLDSMNDGAYKRWHSTEWWSDSYERLWQTSDDSTPQNDKPTNQTQTTTQESVIYLTADSSDELSELKEGETYIIGGICDHNRYKVRTFALELYSTTHTTHYCRTFASRSHKIRGFVLPAYQ